jgi:hypothetical protein
VEGNIDVKHVFFIFHILREKHVSEIDAIDYEEENLSMVIFSFKHGALE